MFSWQAVGEMCLRIAFAALCGALIGIERGWRKRDAGIRTHTIAAVAAAAYMLLSVYAYTDSPFETDYTILATQILYGFSFIGAGMLLKNKYQVVAGLRTAAGIWATVAIGMACGQGLYAVSLAVTLLIVAVQGLFRYGKMDGNDWIIRKIRMTIDDTPEARALFKSAVFGEGTQLLTVKYKRVDDAMQVRVRVRTDQEWTVEQVLDLCDRHKEIRSISI